MSLFFYFRLLLLPPYPHVVKKIVCDLHMILIDQDLFHPLSHSGPIQPGKPSPLQKLADPGGLLRDLFPVFQPFYLCRQPIFLALVILPVLQVILLAEEPILIVLIGLPPEPP